MNECKIVAVLNRKGGVCKTTTTHNLGVALVQRGYRVLLVDCDTQRNLSISLGLNRPDEECYTLCELLQPLIDVEVDEVDIQNCIHHLENGVDFIPNKQALSTVEKQISTLDFRRECILFDSIGRCKVGLRLYPFGLYGIFGNAGCQCDDGMRYRSFGVYA